jgi:hypothetical protein
LFVGMRAIAVHSRQLGMFYRADRERDARSLLCCCLLSDGVAFCAVSSNGLLALLAARNHGPSMAMAPRCCWEMAGTVRVCLFSSRSLMHRYTAPLHNSLRRVSYTITVGVWLQLQQ